VIPVKQDLTVYQGDDFTFTFRIKDPDGTYIDLTGQTPKAEIRQAAGAADVLAEFGADLEDQAVMKGGVTLTLTGAQTAGLAAGSPLAWDVQLTDGNNKVQTYLYGSVSVMAQVTV
jgi:hypothetical protein